MAYQTIKEYSAKVKVPKINGPVSRELPVFYNPDMELNRTISVLLINSWNKPLRIALPLAGTGIRGIRFLKETNNIKSLHMNDQNPESIKIIKTNLKLNGVESSVNNEDANLFLLHEIGFDYIDIDPFGSPNVFLDSSIKRLSRDGILAITATDTSSLCGSYVKPCKRKYWAKPLRNHLMHEIGLRILIRKVQLIGAQYDRALTPILSYSTQHYMRVFFKCKKSKKAVDEIIKKHIFYKSDIGPMWSGNLQDKSLINEMLKKSSDYSIANKFLTVLSKEEDLYLFHGIHYLCKELKIPIPKFELIAKEITNKGYKFSRTHFTPKGIKSDISEEELIEILNNLA